MPEFACSDLGIEPCSEMLQLCSLTSDSMALRSRMSRFRPSMSIKPSASNRLRLRETNSRTVPICVATS